MTLGCLLERLLEMTDEELERDVEIHDGKRTVGLIHGTSTEMKYNNQFTLQIMYPDRAQ